LGVNLSILYYPLWSEGPRLFGLKPEDCYCQSISSF
jgi:hypothetical protein